MLEMPARWRASHRPSHTPLFTQRRCNPSYSSQARLGASLVSGGPRSSCRWASPCLAVRTTLPACQSFVVYARALRTFRAPMLSTLACARFVAGRPVLTITGSEWPDGPVQRSWLSPRTVSAASALSMLCDSALGLLLHPSSSRMLPNYAGHGSAVPVPPKLQARTTSSVPCHDRPQNADGPVMNHTHTRLHTPDTPVALMCMWQESQKSHKLVAVCHRHFRFVSRLLCPQSCSDCLG